MAQKLGFHFKERKHDITWPYLVCLAIGDPITWPATLDQRSTPWFHSILCCLVCFKWLPKNSLFITGLFFHHLFFKTEYKTEYSTGVYFDHGFVMAFSMGFLPPKALKHGRCFGARCFCFSAHATPKWRCFSSQESSRSAMTWIWWSRKWPGRASIAMIQTWQWFKCGLDLLILADGFFAIEWFYYTRTV